MYVCTWNAVVPHDATVFHLGDFALDTKKRLIKISGWKMCLDRWLPKTSFKLGCDIHSLM